MDIQSIQNRYRIDMQTTEINSTKGTLKTCSPHEKDVFFKMLITINLQAPSAHCRPLGWQKLLYQKGKNNDGATAHHVV